MMMDKILRSFARIRGRPTYSSIIEPTQIANIDHYRAQCNNNNYNNNNNDNNDNANYGPEETIIQTTRTESATIPFHRNIVNVVDENAMEVIRKNSGLSRRGGVSEVDIRVEINRLEYRMMEDALDEHFGL